MSVDELVERSINAYIDKMSFTSVGDIVDLLSSLNINQEKIKPLFPIIDDMIRRRHHIVHKADRIKSAGPGKQFAISLSAQKVKKWNNTVNHFFALIVEDYVIPIFAAQAHKKNDKLATIKITQRKKAGNKSIETDRE